MSKKRRIDQKDVMAVPQKPIMVIPLKDLAPVEAAMSIEKVRQKIFSPYLLAGKDLKNVRRVCHQWNVYGAEAMRSRKYSYHRGHHLQLVPFYRQTETNTYLAGASKNGMSLQYLMELMDSSFTHPFPLKAFSFSYMDNSFLSDDLDGFLSKHGHLVETLHLSMNNKLNEELFQNHIVERLPNIRSIRVSFSTWPSFPIQLTKPESVRRRPLAGISANLKSVFFNCEISAELFDAICRLAPNLEEFEVPDSNLPYFLLPENDGQKSKETRLHLLKTLDSDLTGTHDTNKGAFITKIANLEGVLELTSFSFATDSAATYFSKGNVRDDQYNEIRHQIVNTLSKIFEKSAHSLEKLTWSRMRFLKGVRIPKMPKLKTISFESDQIEMEDFEGCDPEFGLYFFPKGFRMSDSFPNLRKIVVDEHCDFENQPDDYFLDNEDEVVSSVKLVRTYNTYPSPKFDSWFPNARIS